MNTPEHITALLNSCAADRCLTPREATLALSSELQGEALRQLLEAAHRRMCRISGSHARLWAAIGVDAAACMRNCAFCSHGVQWGVYPDNYELAPEEVCRQAADIGVLEPDWFTLRTTQDYGIGRLSELVKRVRHVLPPRTEVAVNTGEFDLAAARALKDAGATTVYHTYRLREGVDTGIAPSERMETLGIIRKSGLKLAALVEPVGPEHSDEEIVEAAFRLKETGVSLGGCMARVPVPGTPLAKFGKVDEDRIVRIIAMTRLISGPEVGAICVHPPVPAALCAGANTLVVECGAVPRSDRVEKTAWQGFGFAEAARMFVAAGYKMSTPLRSLAGQNKKET